MNVKLNYNWSVSYNSLIKKDSRKVWEIISTKSNLELFHPFCKKNKVIKWEKEKSIDRIEYLNGSIFEREFFTWKEYKGYDLYIRQLGKSYSYVQWRLSEVGDDCQIKITVFPYLFNQKSKVINYLPFHFIVRPLLLKYLSSVVNGLKWHMENSSLIPKNYFGRHIWFS